MHYLAAFYIAFFSVVSTTPVEFTGRDIDDVFLLDDTHHHPGKESNDHGKKLQHELERLLGELKDDIMDGKEIQVTFLEKIKLTNEKLQEYEDEPSKKVNRILQDIKEEGKSYWAKVLDRIFHQNIEYKSVGKDGSTDESTGVHPFLNTDTKKTPEHALHTTKSDNINQETGLYWETLGTPERGNIRTELGRKFQLEIETLLKQLKEHIEKGEKVDVKSLEKIKKTYHKLQDLELELNEKERKLIHLIKEEGWNYWSKLLDEMFSEENSSGFVEKPKYIVAENLHINVHNHNNEQKTSKPAMHTTKNPRYFNQKTGKSPKTTETCPEKSCNTAELVEKPKYIVAEKLYINVQNDTNGQKTSKPAMHTTKKSRSFNQKTGKRPKRTRTRPKESDNTDGSVANSVTDTLRKLENTNLFVPDTEEISELFDQGSEIPVQIFDLLQAITEEKKRQLLKFIDVITNNYPKSTNGIASRIRLTDFIGNLNTESKVGLTDFIGNSNTASKVGLTDFIGNSNTKSISPEFSQWVIRSYLRNSARAKQGRSRVGDILRIAREFLDDKTEITKNMARPARMFFRVFRKDLGKLYDEILDKVYEILQRN